MITFEPNPNAPADMLTCRRDSMLHVPASALLDAAALDGLLRVENPAWATATPYAKGQMQQWLLFYHMNRQHREVSVPRNFSLDLLQPGVVVKDDTCQGEPATFLLSADFSLRAYQLDFMRTKVAPARLRGETDLHFGVPCGHGKSCMAIYMAAQYQRRTLVLVTTHALAQQFARSAAWVTPDASIEVLESGKNWKLDADLTIATYSMLSNEEKFPYGFYLQFGHLVCDEWHKTGARTYYPILERASCRYRTYLSATLRRKDGLAEVLRQHAGAFLTMQRQTAGATVLPLQTKCWLDLEALKNVNKTQTPFKMLKFGSKVDVVHGTTKYRGIIAHVELGGERLENVKVVVQPEGRKDTYTYKRGEAQFFGVGDLSYAKLDSTIAEEPTRLELVKRVVDTLAERGRTTLVLSRRTQVLYALSTHYATTRPELKQGVVISQKRDEQKAYAKTRGMTVQEQEAYCVQEARVIFGIDKMAEEGLDIERLDTLLLLHPLKDIEQAAGRILRQYAGKKPPLIIYLCDNVRPYMGSWQEAKEMFENLGHVVLASQSWEQFTQRYTPKAVAA